VGCPVIAKALHDSNDGSQSIVNDSVPRSSTNSKASSRLSWVPKPMTSTSFA
jgi:hypothetical protein